MWRFSKKSRWFISETGLRYLFLLWHGASLWRSGYASSASLEGPCGNACRINSLEGWIPLYYSDGRFLCETVTILKMEWNGSNLKHMINPPQKNPAATQPYKETPPNARVQPFFWGLEHTNHLYLLFNPATPDELRAIK